MEIPHAIRRKIHGNSARKKFSLLGFYKIEKMYEKILSNKYSLH